MAEFYRLMQANQLLKEHIDTLLRARGQTRKDLAQWCHRGESWISKIFKEDRREIPLKYLDRIADFFRIATYQLFQPGISGLTERRSALERRTGQDRRLGPTNRLIVGLRTELNKAFPTQSVPHGAPLRSPASAVPGPVLAIIADAERRIAAYYAQHAGEQTPSARRDRPAVSARRRGVRGSADRKN